MGSLLAKEGRYLVAVNWETRFGKPPADMTEGEFRMAMLSTVCQLSLDLNDYHAEDKKRTAALMEKHAALDDRVLLIETKVRYLKIRSSDDEGGTDRREDTIIVVSKAKALAFIGALIAGVVFFVLRCLGIWPSS